MELFDCLNNLYSKRFRYPSNDELSGKMWMINKFVSMDKDLLEYIAYVSKYMFTLKEQYYRLLYRLIPQSGSPRNKYLKTKKEFDQELLEKYSKFFGVSISETADYIRIMEKEYDPEEIYWFVGLEYKEKGAAK